MTFGLIVGNRGFFPGPSGGERAQGDDRRDRKAGTRRWRSRAEETKFGAVETRAEAARCAELFQRHREEIDGVIVTLPNFGDERAIADTLRMAELNVPVLVQATPDTPGRMTIRDRRDSFCGKMSACNNLTQYGIPYSLTTRHTEAPDSEFFRKDLDWFAAVCRVVRGLRRLRIGAIGARPAAFNTVRYSEKILEANGISIETIDLSEILGRIARMKDEDAARKRNWRRSGAMCRPAASPLPRCSRWRNSARWWMAGCGKPRSPSARCSAGPRWKNTSAWFRAR